MLRSRLLILALILAVLGCAQKEPYRIGQAASEIVSADPTLCPELKEASPHKIPVAYVEIDEAGLLPRP